MPSVEDHWEKIYWPFKVQPPDQQTPQQERELRFLESAHKAGFKPYMFGGGNYGATSQSGRGGMIIVRGRNRWEVVLGTPNEKMASFFINDFDFGSNAVCQWLRDSDLHTVLEEAQEFVVQMPGSS